VSERIATYKGFLIFQNYIGPNMQYEIKNPDTTICANDERVWADTLEDAMEMIDENEIIGLVEYIQQSK
jgi:hypothetical protein